jgi:hypothetical protein
MAVTRTSGAAVGGESDTEMSESVMEVARSRKAHGQSNDQATKRPDAETV